MSFHRTFCPDQPHDACPCRCHVRCRFPMPKAKEPCGRLPGHGSPHRTQYAIDNHNRMALGRGLAAEAIEFVDHPVNARWDLE